MSLLAHLKTNHGSRHARKRLGRGDGSGHGGTSGKGHKGQKARSGGAIRRGFEGGQIPLVRRLPKVGFKNTQFKKVYAIVNLSSLNQFDGEVGPEQFAAAGLTPKMVPVKILGRGEIQKVLKVKAHKLSAAARAAIEKAGGAVEVIEKLS